jgi:hypothetical protein
MVTIANRSCIGDLVAEINEVAFNKFKAGAYLHWFYQFGLERDDFENAFLVLDNIAQNY